MADSVRASRGLLLQIVMSAKAKCMEATFGGYGSTVVSAGRDRKASATP